MDIDGDRGFLRREALRRGYCDNDLRTQKRRGVIASPGRGLYVPAHVLESATERERHLLAVRAAVSRSSPEVVVSHESAAMLHGFAMWNPDLSRVHVSSPRHRGGHRNAHRVLHAVGLEDVDVTEIDGLRVTTPARTVADLARTLPFENAVCVGDSGLRMSSTADAAVMDAIRRSSSRGRSNAVRAVEFMDARAETVGESRSRVYVAAHDLPAPDLQVTLLDPDGQFLARPDCLWKGHGAIGEFDGMAKYGAYLRPGERPEDVLAREKRREDVLRSYGWMVVRWTWRDLSTPALAERIRRGLEIAAHMPPPTTIYRP